jgi:hypothetical protein
MKLMDRMEDDKGGENDKEGVRGGDYVGSISDAGRVVVVGEGDPNKNEGGGHGGGGAVKSDEVLGTGGGGGGGGRGGWC